MRLHRAMSVSAAIVAFACAVSRGDEEPVKKFEVDLPASEAPAQPPVSQTCLIDPQSGASSWSLVADSGAGGVFVPASVTPISLDYFGESGSDVTVAWTLALGSFTEPGGTGSNAGALRADVWVSLPPSEGGGCLNFSAASIIPATSAQALQGALATGVMEPVTGEPIEGEVRFCMGSSCSCPRCADGTLFAAPFFVLGVCNVPGGQNCCAGACQAACAARASGRSIEDAWIQGQGSFIICMLLEPSN